MTSETVDARVRSVLDAAGGIGRPTAELKRTDDLFAAGLTSYATVQVMLMIEEEFDVEMPDRLMTRTTFQSIAALADAVESLLAEAEQA